MNDRGHSGTAARPIARFDGAVEASINIELDEELLRRGAPAVRTAVQAGMAVSLGVAQALDGAVARAASSLGLTIARRRSGGTGLLHREGDIYWSLVVPRVPGARELRHLHAYDELGAGVSRYLADLGIEAAWTEPFDRSDRYCLLGPRGRVLTSGGRAFGGAAQHLTATALLHQGVVNLGLDRDVLAHLFDVRPEILEACVTSLRELGVTLGPEILARGLLAALRDQFPRA
ncbi:MAG: hypothetical protein L3J93_04985 [Thermoplasmata archaeon]|nr:hypothetical protein [Thermoplasmata archaeon]